MQRLRTSFLRTLVPARGTPIYMPQWPRPDLRPKVDHVDGLPFRDGDETFHILARDEIETRMVYSLKNYPFLDMQKFDFNKKFTEMGLDSLEVISAITSIENEFNMVFADNEFDNFTNFQDIVDSLSTTPNVI